MEEEVKLLKKELAKANSLLRSAYSIAEREGEKTNWWAFRLQLLQALEDEREILQGYWAEEYDQLIKTVTVGEK
jgi:hypothetical protein